MATGVDPMAIIKFKRKEKCVLAKCWLVKKELTTLTSLLTTKLW